jgi:class 3 adenylate cyclase
MLEAIADLQLGAKPEPTPLAASSTVAAPAKDTAAERRQVTVMFSDLVGSTALGSCEVSCDLNRALTLVNRFLFVSDFNTASS